MENLKNVAPIEDFNWEAYENGDAVSNVSREDLEKAYDNTLNKVNDREVVDGTVIAMNKREVVVNIGYKSDGIIPLSEFRYNPDLKARDFSFIAEEKLSHIFAVLAQYKLKLNLMQNSAISFSFCVDCNSAVFNEFLDQLREEFEVRYNQDVKLITIRHYNEEIIREIIGDIPSLVEQRSRTTAQFVLKNVPTDFTIPEK